MKVGPNGGLNFSVLDGWWPEGYDGENGWAIPTATDIAFSYLVGRIVFGAGHPAVRFLLLLAIADDAPAAPPAAAR